MRAAAAQPALAAGRRVHRAGGGRLEPLPVSGQREARGARRAAARVAPRLLPDVLSAGRACSGSGGKRALALRAARLRCPVARRGGKRRDRLFARSLALTGC